MKFYFCRKGTILSKANRLITIGAFDGIHLGHQKLLRKINELHANDPKSLRTLITFEPLPHEYFMKNGNSPTRILSLREKLIYLKNSKLIDEVIIIPFNLHWSTFSAENFLNDFLLNYCNLKAIVVGEDFKFGKGAKGDYSFLARLAKRLHFDVYKEDYFFLDNTRVSSTLVRAALHESNFSLAKEYLGRDYHIIGKVAYGNKLARNLGMPTINLPLERHTPPFTGVYNVRAISCKLDKIFSGVANIGFRPTVNGRKPNLEIHLHNVDLNLYGQTFEVAFINKIREEMKFSSINELKEQIHKDNRESKTYFNIL